MKFIHGKGKMLSLCLSASTLFWLLDAMLDSHYKNSHHSLLESLFTDDPIHEFYWRLLVTVLFMSIGVIASRYTNIIDAINIRYSKLFDNVNDAICTVSIDNTLDRRMKFSEANRSASAMLGYRREELFNLSLEDLVTKPEIPLPAGSFPGDKHIVFEAELVKKDGERLVGQITAYPFNGPGDPRALLILRDVKANGRDGEGLRESGNNPEGMAPHLPDANTQRDRRTNLPHRISGWLTKPRHHVVISGTGRAGTTFLVQLMTALNLDTGFDSLAANVNPVSHAGMESDLRRADAPYIVKSPWFCDTLDEILRSKRIVIDRVIIPMRDLYSAAESRRTVSQKTGRAAAPGGMWHTEVPEEQESVLTRKLYDLFLTMAEHDIPVILLRFPRIVNDPEYLYKKLRFLLPGVGYEEFMQTFRAVSRPDLVHDFNP